MKFMSKQNFHIVIKIRAAVDSADDRLTGKKYKGTFKNSRSPYLIIFELLVSFVSETNKRIWGGFIE